MRATPQEANAESVRMKAESAQKLANARANIEYDRYWASASQLRPTEIKDLQEVATANNRNIYALAHIGWGLALTLVAALYVAPWLAALAVLGFALVKESAESIWGLWDAKQPWSGMWLDTLQFCIGIVLAMVAILVARW